MTTNNNKVLKLSTSGSVDDGKSTLIGSILYETKSLPDDKLAAIQKRSKEKGYDYLDFSLATDGLVAEREQGITIDVAHIYFSTPKRSYIIADTPGHIEYTRNMVTGTSTSQVSIILIDARHGVIEQTKRHFFITNLMKIKEVVVAINKMDLVDFDVSVYNKIVDDFKKMIEATGNTKQNIVFIPVSALMGDNIKTPSNNMPWYKETTIVDYLENLEIDTIQSQQVSRFQVQTVIRPKTMEHIDFRGYAGKLKSGELSIGDAVTILPSGKKSTIKSIEFYNQTYQKASVGSSMTITLHEDINISRGDFIVKSEELPNADKIIKAKICWMDDTELQSNNQYLLQHGVKKVKAKIKSIDNKISISQLGTLKETAQLKMNDLGNVTIQLANPLHYDRYEDNPGNGAFILIDTKTNNTAGVGFIQ